MTQADKEMLRMQIAKEIFLNRFTTSNPDPLEYCLYMAFSAAERFIEEIDIKHLNYDGEATIDELATRMMKGDTE